MRDVGYKQKCRKPFQNSGISRDSLLIGTNVMVQEIILFIVFVVALGYLTRFLKKNYFTTTQHDSGECAKCVKPEQLKQRSK